MWCPRTNLLVTLPVLFACVQTDVFKHNRELFNRKATEMTLHHAVQSSDATTATSFTSVTASGVSTSGSGTPTRTLLTTTALATHDATCEATFFVAPATQTQLQQHTSPAASGLRGEDEDASFSDTEEALSDDDDEEEDDGLSDFSDDDDETIASSGGTSAKRQRTS